MVMTLKERLYRFRSFWIFPVLAFVLLSLSFRTEPSRNRTDLLWLFVVGLFAWTLIEYGMHRFLFHVHLPFKSAKVREIVNGSHFGHHASPRDATKILVHPSYGIVVSSIVYGLLYTITGSVLSASGVLVGIWAGFLYYESVHYRVHLSLSGSGFVARQRRMHFYHHFTNNKRCFGVTTPLWDYVFRTR